MKLQILFLLIVPPILLCLCAIVMMGAPLPHPFPPALSGARNQISAILTGVLGIGYIAGLTLYVVYAFLRVGRALDTVLTSAGLSAESYMAFGRQYRGVLDGRKVRVTFVPGQGMRPMQLNVYVEADLNTKVAVARQKPLLNCTECTQLSTAGTEMEDFVVYAREADRANLLLNNASSRQALLRLLRGHEELGAREVYLQHGRVWFRAHPHSIPKAHLAQWLNDVLALAEASDIVLSTQG